MELQGNIIDNATQRFPYPVGARIRYIGDLYWETKDGTVLLKKGMEFIINFAHDGWVGTYMEGYPVTNPDMMSGPLGPMLPWNTYQDAVSNVCIYMQDTKDWEVIQ